MHKQISSNPSVVKSDSQKCSQEYNTNNIFIMKYGMCIAMLLAAICALFVDVQAHPTFGLPAQGPGFPGPFGPGPFNPNPFPGPYGPGSGPFIPPINVPGPFRPGPFNPNPFPGPYNPGPRPNFGHFRF
ncbi:PREDICTED: prophenin and tritrpticin precursor-like [Dinoponera quadriceps]|uniref:Prophenin and tritrpticin precursor-like n=1 Tax=Dinoponera quadriceps TaxID=609295 RepID=A0A6P3WX49_DINQU|nr:PREDICTED: prophenin and tritrpticin precursor-like [Dinoponera quadriceps]